MTILPSAEIRQRYNEVAEIYEEIPAAFLAIIQVAAGSGIIVERILKLHSRGNGFTEVFLKDF